MPTKDKVIQDVQHMDIIWEDALDKAISRGEYFQTVVLQVFRLTLTEY